VRKEVFEAMEGDDIETNERESSASRKHIFSLDIGDTWCALEERRVIVHHQNRDTFEVLQ
jgi:hypothetical protein